MKDDINPAASAPDAGAFPDKDAIRKAFMSKAGARKLLVDDIAGRMEKALASIAPRPTIKKRTKTFDSYYGKYFGQLKTGVAAPRITDLMGIRIVCPFMDNLPLAERLIQENFDVIELDRKGGLYTFKEFSFREFGYESIHMLIKIPADLTRVRGDAGCEVIEIQIRTILQDAWAEVEHEIFYKSQFSPMDLQKRKLAAVCASLFLADTTFQEVRAYQQSLNGQLGKRRTDFHHQIEEINDSFIHSWAPDSQEGEFEKALPAIPEPQPVADSREAKGDGEISLPDLEGMSIDDLLLKALTLHNYKRFEQAAAIYGVILETKKPAKAIRSLIHKHRGLAHFAQLKYDAAISDFTEAVGLDEKSHASLYYRGVVHSVLRRYPKAIDDFTLALKINPFQSYCLFRRGQAFYHMEDYLQALADCDASLAIDSANGVVCKFRDLIQDKLETTKTL